jgi:RNA polymerase sigma-70 factor (ECF subfamily)
MDRATTTSASHSEPVDEVAFVQARGDEALAEVFNDYRPRLEQMIRFRLDRRLLGRVDPADVLQETYIEVARRFHSYAAQPTVSLYVWIRQIAWQTLLMVHRRHLGQKRDAGQEMVLDRHVAGQSSLHLTQLLAASLTSPSQAVMRDENLAMLRRAIDDMDTIDREILVLRHFEQLSNANVAEVLRLSPTAASNRYVRALRRLRAALDVLSNS